METTSRVHTRDLKPSTDGAILRAFLDASPRPLTLTLRAAAQGFEASKAWWHGAFNEGGEMKAVTWMDGKFVTMYSAHGDAIRAIANTMRRQAAGRPGRDGHTHHLFGPYDTLSDFWDVFRSLPRTLVGDHSPALMACASPKDAPATTRVAPTTSSDLRMLFEFTADLAIEQGYPDPRRTARLPHEKHCQDLIAGGRQLIGTDGGKPCFIAELAPLDAHGAILNNVYVPRPFRRPAVISRLLSAAAKLALQRAPEAFTFCEDPSGPYAEGALAAGFTNVAGYRHIMLKGS